ncbi:hypothetical protein [Antarcticimicrobium luteum]|uniref:Uncharacterized protein n=1 Tax=Antarcticimicrobium luteum TaxID=2547397 RepID=A0A4R5UX59_9RHOB|nr:hypothetical protein [Antarcticimicrobium luteum]TDK43869.1 hypothetical protein E1832_16475 [Antarcticimicrobium luteum]
MSVSRWIIAVAFGLAFIASASAGIWAIWSLEEYYAHDRQDIAERQNSEAHSGIDACGEIPYVFSASKCIRDAIDSANEEYTSYKDLKAQQHMSLSALGVLIVSAITMFVTSIGVVFVYYTLRETKNTADQAKREADIAEDSFRTLERPFLAVKITDTYRLHNNQGGVRSIDYTVVNAGRSPAVLTAVRHHLGKTVEKGELDACYDVIQSGGELNNQRHVALSETESAAITESDRIVFLVQLSFMDVTGVGGETVWRFIKDGTRPFVLLDIA